MSYFKVMLQYPLQPVVFAKGLHKISHKKAAPRPSDQSTVSHKGWLIDVQLLLRLSITLRITLLQTCDGP